MDTERSGLSLNARRLAGVAVFAVLACVPAVLPGYLVFQATIALTYAIAILGLNLLMGFNGQVSLAQGVFFAVGGYLVAILVADHSVPIWLAIVIAVVATAVLGALVGIPALRLQGLQLAIVTLVLAALVPSLILRLDEYTKGTAGIAIDVPPPPAWLGVGTDAWHYWICLAGAGVCVLIMVQLVHGETGRRLRAVRDNTTIAEAFGINVAATRIATFATSAAFGGFAGGLFAMVNAFVSPDSFQLFKSFEFLAGAIIGGITSITGAFLGALLVIFLPEWSAGISLAMAGIVYGGTLIVMMLVAREGLVGLAVTIVRWGYARLFARPARTPVVHAPSQGGEPAVLAKEATTGRSV
jgi:branched-chain amino acid transport system permease protein